jgi:hypothetical protein
VMPQLHSSQHSWCVVFRPPIVILRAQSLALPHPSFLCTPLSLTHSVRFWLSRCMSGSVQAERDAALRDRDAQLSDLRARLVCVAMLCSAWCLVSRPLVSLVMPISIRGSEKPCWMRLARSSVKRVARLINCDRSWYDASFAGVSFGSSSLLTVALVGCIRRLGK